MLKELQQGLFSIHPNSKHVINESSIEPFNSIVLISELVCVHWSQFVKKALKVTAVHLGTLFPRFSQPLSLQMSPCSLCCSSLTWGVVPLTYPFTFVDCQYKFTCDTLATFCFLPHSCHPNPPVPTLVLQITDWRRPWEGETSLHHPNFPSLSEVLKQPFILRRETRPCSDLPF